MSKPLSILILTPFRNEEHSLSQYLASLKAIEYPKNLVEVYWLENDSSDDTLNILKEARPTIPFYTTLQTARICGPVKKQTKLSYTKDVPYGPKRIAPWRVILNKYFYPKVRESKQEYVLLWWADAVVPPNTITEYLKVFELKPNAGWVVGALCRRYPMHRKIYLPKSAIKANTITELPCAYPQVPGHCILIPRVALAKTVFTKSDFDLVRGIKKQGLKIYYQPSVFIKHISNDGKIYTHTMTPDIEPITLRPIYL